MFHSYPSEFPLNIVYGRLALPCNTGGCLSETAIARAEADVQFSRTIPGASLCVDDPTNPRAGRVEGMRVRRGTCAGPEFH
jgi:hypothetical protein